MGGDVFSLIGAPLSSHRHASATCFFDISLKILDSCLLPMGLWFQRDFHQL